MNARRNHPPQFVIALTAILVGVMPMNAAPPDLTAGGTIPSNLTTTWNLGPTGMRGWVYYDTTGGGINGSVDSRQIQVREVDAGSPAATSPDGAFLPNDLILGASGTAAAPVLFNVDARRGLAAAIADTEAQTPANLKLIRWRAGAQSVVTLSLSTMGAYSATAPYNCPKSEKILEEGMDYYYNSESSGRYRMGVLSLLATQHNSQNNFFPAPDRALYLQKAQNEARALIKSASALNDLRNYTATTAYPTVWGRAHELILLGEYYLITGDSQVFPTIEALAINIAKGASHFGTMAHSLRQGSYDASNNYRPVNTGYGVVNSIGMPCLLGVQLAKQCGVDDPVVDDMIGRAKMFYASYAKRGAIPYGEHEAYDARHENNGKSGLAALVLDNDPNYEDQAEFFVMMALASGDTDRDVGHTGAYFNYLWAPLGVQRGGPSAVQEYFGKISWLLDLHRRWDGGFDYDSYSENNAPNGREYYDFRMSTAMLLTYALPLESLHITGRDSTGTLALSPGQVSDSIDVEDYDAAARTTAQLVADLAVWSPKVRLLASAELGGRSIDTATRDEIRAKALDVNGTSRYGAIQALGEIDDTAFTGQLVSLLNDGDGYVRTLAAKALHKFNGSHKVPYRSSMMTTLVNRELPVLPPVPDDPLQSDQGALISTIFGSGGFANNRSEMDTLISQVGSQLFFDALKVASRHPGGSARGRVSNLYNVLTPAEVNLMAPELVDMLALESPADRMFSLGVRAEAMRAMQRSLLAEAVPAAMQAMDNSNGWGGFHENLFNVLIGYGGSSTLVTPDPGVEGFAQRYLTGATVEEAQALLDAIAADTNPPPPTAFKSINSATADDPILTLPANSTVLRVSGFDYLQGDSIYTWNKIAGPGAVTISPNGTSGTASTVQFDGTAGTYQFEVKMSDSLGFTEVYESVTVFLVADGEVDDDPPIPNPASFDVPPAADSETAVSMTATTGSDASGSVEYLFSEVTGNPGGTSSGWQTSPSYTDNGLSPLTNYAYMVTMRDSLGNTGTTSSAAGVTTPGTPPPSDIISVNFYAYGGLSTENRNAVTLEANETAGVGGWRTGGWENYAVPWGLSSPRPPVSISSGQGSTATLILNDVRNGGPYNNPNPHVLLPGDGNGDLMDGHCNGTEDPYDESAKFDMVVSGVPFGTYDVIVYVGANKAQFGNGTGKFVFNGGAEQDFKLTSGEFMSFAKITNGTAPGNYLLFENVTGSSFTLRMWGNGFNHIGPTGFQIASAGTTSDVDPPTPNAASFATPPQANGTDSISMTATAGTDASGPVEYLFSCLTAGGHGSGWQTSPSYTDSGLIPDTEYVYTVTMRDARGNTGSASIPASATTMAGADVTPPFLDPVIWASAPAPAGDTSITMTAMTATDPSGVEYYFTCTSGGGHDSGWQDSPTYTDTGLTPGTIYSYSVTVRDKSPAQNTSEPSDAASATTNESPLSAPLKVFILAGQSNMEGHGEMNPAFSQGTLDYLVTNDPTNYGHLKNGANWAEWDDVWISYKRGGTTLLNGNLSAGFGVSATTIGPELQFGVELGDYLGEQVLLIKTAWGGKSLYVDFRPPTSGWSVNPPVAAGDQGFYYQEMLNDVSSVLANLSTYFPDYATIGSYEFAGFGWHQGWNDRVDSAAVAEYEANMENFIKDVRSDLGAIHPSGVTLPFVIATTGIGGPNETGTNALALMDAQLAMEDFVKYPDFEDNVLVVDTREFWREASESPADQNFHWNRNAETYFLIGQSMATHMRVLLEGGDTTPPDPSPMTWATTPIAAGEGEITMTATTATDIIGVEYYFEETSANPGGNDSGWQNSPTYLDTGLSNSTNYTYRVKARDKSPDQNETAWSTLESGTTTPADTIAPTPNPLTWAIAPTPLSSRVITMTASTASDPSGVEYYFTNTTISGHDSGWQDSPEYTDANLDPSTSYTYEVKARDKSVAANETAPSAPTVATTLAPPPPGPLIYEPFDDLDPTLNGNTPGLGLSGTWSAASAVSPGSLSYGSLATSGGRAATGGSQFQENGISPGNTLTNAGLMVDGSTLWFSALIVNYNSVPAPTTDNRTYLAIGTGNADGFDRIGGTPGSGFTVAVSKVSPGGVTAQAWNDGSDGTGGATRGSTVTVPNNATFLAVGKITWGKFGVQNDVFELYLPGTDLVQGAPISTITADFDQLGLADPGNAFDTISFTGGRPNLGVPELDEIRFGATYADVVVNTNDNTAPTPDPMTWAAVPAASSSTAITMTASTATDASGVEYFFDETSGNPGGSDSGWQDSPTYIDTGLNPSTTYSYQVRARDKSSAQNETGLSPLESATTDSGQATSLIYEPFADLHPTLSGNTPGLGLTGTWSSGALVADRSLTYGKLGYQGGRVVTNPGNAVDTGTVSPGTTLTGSGLMNDGATLWFSVLIVKHPDTSITTDERTTYFSLGTGGPDGFDRIGGNTGSGFAVVINQNNAGLDRIQGWNNNSAGTGGAFRSPLVSYGPEGETILAVGKITWGAFNVTNDVFELYLPDKDLNLGSPVSTLNGNFDQLGTANAANAFDTIGFAGKRGATGQNNVPEIDEIRFAANSADVLPLDFVAPVLVSTDNASGSGIQRVATFDEELVVGTGDIRIVNETTPGTTTITLPDPRVVLSGKTLTITPTLPLSDDTFHIEIDAGALTDRNLNEFAGISDPNLWKFTVDGTPPSVASFGDNTFPKPILTNSSTLVYTVTFSEPIDAGTVEIADFAATAGSVPITVDSVSATGDPAVFEVAVSTVGTTGTLTLEIVQGAVIADVNGLELVTTTAIPSDNTLTVNDPVPNAGGITNDFQGTIASETNALTTGEARFFNVSVNPDNPGTGWYGANLPGTDDPAPAGVRNYTGPVVAYKMLGNSSDGDVTTTAGVGGDDARITYTTEDPTFDGFGQQQLRLWTTNDPGADLATSAGAGATGFDNSIGNYGYRDWQGASGIVDISGLASGSVHVYYGAYNSTPTLKVIMRDTDNVGADIVLNDVHSVADGGNGDAANLCEYYFAEIDFVSDGVYDVIIYEWFSSNGRGLGTVLTGPDSVVASSFGDWAGGYVGLTDPDPALDFDAGGLETGLEWVLGGDPTDPADDAGIAPTFDNTTDPDFFIFTYRRDHDAAADANSAIKVEYGSDLVGWTEAVAGADIEINETDNGATDSVEVKIRRTLAAGGKLFARLNVVVSTP